MLLDVPVRWGRWPMIATGHLLITDQRIVRSPSNFWREKPSEIRTNDLTQIQRREQSGIGSLFNIDGDYIDLIGGASRFRVSPTPGWSWMGGFSVATLERDIRDALDRGGQTVVKPG
jgi:hypothetical protein